MRAGTTEVPDRDQSHLPWRKGIKDRQEKDKGMGRIIKALVLLLILGLIGLTGYAYLVDLTPPRTEVRMPVVLDAE